MLSLFLENAFQISEDILRLSENESCLMLLILVHLSVINI